MPSDLPYMEFYPGDYRKDTAHLRPVEHHAYLFLIFAYWDSGKPLPSDSERLRRLAAADAEGWPEIKAELESFFTVVGDTWVHERIERDLAKARERREAAKARGIASGEARRTKANRNGVESKSKASRKQVDTNSKPSRNGRGNGDQMETNSSSSSSSSSSALTGGDSSLRSELSSPQAVNVPAKPIRRRSFGEWPSEQEARNAFAKFWPLYYKRGGSTEAFEVFLRFVTPAEMDDLIQATIAHATFRAKDVKHDDPDGRKYTQGAKTWLLNRRWRDWLKTDEVAAQMATAAPVLTPAQKSAADARRKRELLLAEMERRQAEKQGSLLP